MPILLWLLNNRKLALWALGALALISALLLINRWADKKCEAANNTETIKVVEHVKVIRDNVAKLPVGESSKRLREKWSR